jgi:hypothetical protein
MLNAGAIMMSSLLLNLVHPDMKMSEKFDFVENYLQRIGGGEFFRSGTDFSHNYMFTKSCKKSADVVS